MATNYESDIRPINFNLQTAWRRAQEQSTMSHEGPAAQWRWWWWWWCPPPSLSVVAVSFQAKIRANCPGAGACWEEFVDQNSIFGQRYDAYKTLPSCQAFCVSVAACVAIDFNFNDMSCWLHVNPIDLYANNTYFQSRTNQYRLDRTCVTSTGALDVRFHIMFIIN